jgi:hypothetical protein
MASKIKLYLLDCGDVDAEFVERINTVNGETYASLRLRLHEFGVVEWSFNFWDVEGNCQIRGKLEGMTTIDPHVYLIPSPEIESGPRKCHCGLHVSAKVDSASPHSDPTVDVLPVVNFPFDDDTTVGSSLEMRDTGTEPLLKSTFITNEVRQSYLKVEQKLRDALKAICLGDHEWCVKS